MNRPIDHLKPACSLTPLKNVEIVKIVHIRASIPVDPIECLRVLLIPEIFLILSLFLYNIYVHFKESLLRLKFFLFGLGSWGSDFFFFLDGGA